MKGLHRRLERGDFQTPPELARRICRILRASGERPVSVFEPTCGRGNFLVAARDVWPGLERLRGVELDPDHVAAADRAVASRADGARVEVREADIFEVDAADTVADLPDPLLVVGNPPWVTSAALGRVGGTNRPARGNPTGLAGIEAVTGRSNFDISEWILRRLVGWLEGRDATLAVLCKSSVARRVLAAAWEARIGIASSEMRSIDTRAHFGASTSAGLLVMRFGGGRAGGESCPQYESLEAVEPVREIGWRAGRLVADLPAHDRTAHLAGRGLRGWRSGVKHDCVRVFVLRSDGDGFVNGYGERIELEAEVVFPLLSTTRVARRAKPTPDRWLLVPQRATGEDPAGLRERAPRAWRYLLRHGERLDGRRSAIYRRRPRFSIFGVGAYTFAPWKVVVSGFHEPIAFRVVGPHRGRPVVLGDTAYGFACTDRAEARILCRLLESLPAREFLSSGLFGDAKRPVTAQNLNRLDLAALGRELGLPAERVAALAARQRAGLP